MKMARVSLSEPTSLAGSDVRPGKTEDVVVQLQQGLPQGVIGTWRRFGMVGPVYEIVRKEADLPSGDSLMRIRVVETGEEISYKLTDILDDPAER